jgi:hypothetical protein
MIRKILNYYHIRFQRKNRAIVLFQLIINLSLEKIWKIWKILRGINRPIIHLYAVCWNEAKILPFVLDYYSIFVDYFYIYDNYSDDETDEILKYKRNVTVRKFDTGSTFNDLVHQKIKNTVWKESRGKADWVIVIDMDELIYHPHLIDFLHVSKNTIFTPYGYNMVTDVFPESNELITDQVKSGVPDSKYAKMVLFNPHKIVEVNYEPGAHEAYPEGIIKMGTSNDLKLLHYKNLGVNYVMGKIRNYRSRLSQQNRENNHGLEYERQDKIVVDEIKTYLDSAVQVID